MQTPNTGNPALNALVEMLDTEISAAIDNPQTSFEVRNVMAHASLAVDALLSEIRKKNEFITFMLPVHDK